MVADTQVTLLIGGAVVTVDAERRTLDPGAVAVASDRIVAIDTPDVLRNRYSGATEVYLDHAVILPGLVDSHGHAGHGLTKGIADGTGNVWLDVVAEIYFRGSDEEFWRAESFLSALEHLEFGVTTSLSMTGSMPRVDDPKYAEAAASGYAALGLRHIVALGPPSPPFPKLYRDVARGLEVSVDLDHALATTRTVIQRLNGTADGRISVFVGPSGLVAETDDGRATDFAIEQLRGVLTLANESGVNIHTHARAGDLRATASVLPEILGPRLTLAHCVGISLEEIDIMAESGVSASHGPLTHAYASARFPMIEALDAGVNVAISTDGSAPDRSFDLLSMGRIAAQLQRAHFNDTELLPAGKILEMMTIDAARALGMHHQIGSLEVGKKADIVAMNLRSARMSPRFMVPQRVVNVGSGLDVEFVMVDGQVLMQGRSFESIDVERILDDADNAARAAYVRAGVLHHLAQPPNMWRAVRY